jgi:hypothetical protein
VSTSPIVDRLRHPREQVYQFFLYAAGALVWLIVALTFVVAVATNDIPALADFVLYGIGIPAFVFFAAGLYRAQAFGNMVLLGPEQCPALYQMVVEGARELGLNTPPRTFLYNANGVMNAFARLLLGGRYVFLTSALVDVQDDAQCALWSAMSWGTMPRGIWTR